MTKTLGIYKCGVCGNMAEVLENGAGDLICCGQPMQLMEARTGDPATEKHVPFAEAVEGGLLVRIGQNDAHPMDKKHFIQWIEVVADGRSQRQMLRPGDEPEAFFAGLTDNNLSISEFCNLHGLWAR